MRGYFEIGIYNGKTVANLGTLWRSAYQLGAAGIFIIGGRFKRQASDTTSAYKHVPLRVYENFEHFMSLRPYSCMLVAVEMGGEPLANFTHPERACYLLGTEDNGLPKAILEKCQRIVSLESVKTNSYNVAVAGSLVMYNRVYCKKS